MPAQHSDPRDIQACLRRSAMRYDTCCLFAYHEQHTRFWVHKMASIASFGVLSSMYTSQALLAVADAVLHAAMSTIHYLCSLWGQI